MQVAELLAECLGIPTDERVAFVRFARAESRQSESTQSEELTESAPWRAAQRQRTNLPVPLTPLIGRSHEVAAVSALLMRERARLVTLTGPPGIGKTRLSLEVASEVTGEFEDGVFFVSLAPISDPGLVLPTIARSLHISEVAGRSLTESLKEYLGNKRALLVLDNFEHVIGAAAQIVDILTASPWLKALVTSREPLRVRGERRFVVPPLDVPDLAHLPDASSLLGYSSVALFVERAQETNPDFELTDESAVAVATLCTQLDGLPLAIELVAAHSDVLPSETVLHGLDNRLALRSELQDVPPRHQTLRDATRWSYDLLDAGEQKLFARLGVFLGGCTRSAAEAVCNAQGDLSIKISKGLLSLANKSLLNEQRPGPEMQNSVWDETRYTMLQTIHEYALERLQQSHELGIMRRLHAEYYLALAEAAESELEGPQQAELMDRLENEHDNLRAALDWGLATGEGELALQLSGALAHFWSVRGHLSDGRSRLEAALAQSGNGVKRGRAKALVGAGLLAARQGDYAQAKAFYKQGLAIYRMRDDKKGMALALSRLGAVSNEQCNLDRANGYYQESLTLYREIGDKAGIAGILNNLGNQEVMQGNADRALEFYQDSLEMARELGNKRKVTTALLNLGRLALYHTGDQERATAYLKESLSLCQALGNKVGIAASLYQLGQAMFYQKNLAQAQAYFEESLYLCEQLREKPGIASTNLGLGLTILMQGGHKQARTLLSESLTLFQEQGLKVGVIESLESLAGLAVMEGEAEDAARLLGAVQALREDLGLQVSALQGTPFIGWVEQTRAIPGADRYGAASDIGRSMTLDQAVLFALRADDIDF